VIKRDGPPSFDPKTGTHYAYTGQSSSAYMRLTRTVDLTTTTAPTLQFAASYDTESNYDYVFVEAHTVGQDDWTTLPDLNGHKGKQVELSITYVTDPSTVGLGVFLDDVSIADGATTLTTTSFEDGLGGWAVGGAPTDSGANGGDWHQTASVGFVDGVGVQTRNELYYGFGLEGVTGAANRATLVQDSLRTLGVGR
jgi:bacillopeptidase F (M6 metalloprotease family)